MKPTIYDIAEAAGVSIATVSKVLNDTGRISQATRKRVLQTIDKLSYERSTIASALAGKNTFSIGFILPDVNNPYFSEIVRGAEDEAFDHGYSVFICNTDHNAEKELAYIKTLRQKQMDGIVIATGSMTADAIRRLVEAEIRVVLASREISGAQVGTVTVDNREGGRLAARHLLDLGHKFIGFITEPLTVGSARDRLLGFEEVLHESDARYIVSEDTGFGISTGARSASKLLQTYPLTALFAANDQLAVGALKACQELGRRVPEDISVIGFDDTIFSRIVTPALTSVAQPMYDLGRRTISLLIDAIETVRQPTETVIFEPKLIVRESTARAGGKAPAAAAQ